MSCSDCVRASYAPDVRATPLIIEFVGTPGAGKSTLARELVRFLRGRGLVAGTFVDVARDHVVRTKTGRAMSILLPSSIRRAVLWQVFYVAGIGHALRFGHDSPGLVSEVLRSQGAAPVLSRSACRVISQFMHLSGRYRFLSRTACAHEALVLDDGFLHRSVHLYASHGGTPDVARVTRYVDLVPRPDLTVYVNTSRGSCERRIRERGIWPHRRHLTDAQLSRYVGNAGSVVDAAVQRARALGWDLVEVSNDGEPSHATRELADHVGRYIGDERGREERRG